MPHPYAQDDDALINPLSHDDWPEPTEEEIARIIADDEHVSPQTQRVQSSMEGK